MNFTHRKSRGEYGRLPGGKTLTELSKYYEDSLYPIQDGVLRLIQQSATDFFLTGGTALSRGYYNHRYSDDLDFFVDNSKTFDEQVDACFDILKSGGFRWDEHTEFIRNAGFVSLKVYMDNPDICLKLDFVNDLVPHFGEFVSLPLYHRVDPVQNILSNKIGALFRGAGRDVADIREIALHESFAWDDVISEASEKDAGVGLELISGLLDTVPKWAYDQVNWKAPAPSWEEFDADVKRIVHDMIRCQKNSLH
jgi:hypothetical protein